MFALCMPSDKVVYKSDMQGDKIHATRTSHNPMQSAVVLSVNTIILPILEGLNDKTQELKFDFNAARTYKEWLHNSHGGGRAGTSNGGYSRLLIASRAQST